MPRRRGERVCAPCPPKDGSVSFSPTRSIWRTRASQRRLTSVCGIELLYLPLVPCAEPPKFKDCAKQPIVEESGFVLYYTDQCPFTYYWVPRVVEAAKAHHIPLKVIHVTSREQAQNVPSPVTTYVLFRDGKFLTQGIQSDKKFLKLAGVEAQ